MTSHGLSSARTLLRCRNCSHASRRHASPNKQRTLLAYDVDTTQVLSYHVSVSCKASNAPNFDLRSVTESCESCLRPSRCSPTPLPSRSLSADVTIRRCPVALGIHVWRRSSLCQSPSSLKRHDACPTHSFLRLHRRCIDSLLHGSEGTVRNRYQSAVWRERTSASQPPWSRRGHKALVSAVVALTRRLDQREPFSAFPWASSYGWTLWFFVSTSCTCVFERICGRDRGYRILRHRLLRIDMVALGNRHVDLQSKLVQRPGNNARLADRSAISTLRSAHGSLQPVLHFATSTPPLEVLQCLRPSVYKRLGHPVLVR